LTGDFLNKFIMSTLSLMYVTVADILDYFISKQISPHIWELNSNTTVWQNSFSNLCMKRVYRQTSFYEYVNLEKPF